MRFTFYRKPGTIRMDVNFLQNYMNVRTSMPTVTASICMCCFGLFLKLPSAHNVLSSQRPFTPSEKEDMRVPFFLLSIDTTYSTAHSMKSPTRFIDTCAGSHWILVIYSYCIFHKGTCRPTCTLWQKSRQSTGTAISGVRVAPAHRLVCGGLHVSVGTCCVLTQGKHAPAAVPEQNIRVHEQFIANYHIPFKTNICNLNIHVYINVVIPGQIMITSNDCVSSYPPNMYTCKWW